MALWLGHRAWVQNPSYHQMDFSSVVPSPPHPCTVWNQCSASKQLWDFKNLVLFSINLFFIIYFYFCLSILNVFSSDYSSTELIYYDKLKQNRKERRVWISVITCSITSKRCSFPGSSSNKLKGSGRNLLPCWGYSNNNRCSPAFVAWL